jgi:hypothetical protein
MKCRKLVSAKMDEERANIEKLPLYVPGQKDRATVRLAFNLDPKDVGKAIFVISSNRLGMLVYRGPYTRTLFLEMDADLALHRGYDNLEFKLLQLELKQICICSNERDYAYWRPDAEISIVFLQEGVFDDDHLFKQFDVTIR